MSLLYPDYAAVKARKRLYVTSGREKKEGVLYFALICTLFLQTLACDLLSVEKMGLIAKSGTIKNSATSPVLVLIYGYFIFCFFSSISFNTYGFMQS